MNDIEILSAIEEAKAQQRSLLPTGVLDDKTTQFVAHNRNPGSPCQCLDCRVVRDSFSRDVV